MSVYGKNAVPSSGQRIVQSCLDRLGDLLCGWLEKIDGEIAEDLFGLANDARDRIIQTQYFDLRSLIQRQWPEFISAFRDALRDSQSGGPELTLDISDFSGLSLVDDDKLSENILVREFAARLAETCNEELFGLDHRMAALLDIQDVTQVDNPIGPSILCQALADAATKFCVSSEQRTLLLRQLERRLNRVLPALYREINEHLIGLNVLPNLKKTFQRSGAGDSGNRSAALPSQTTRTTGPAEGDLFAALQKLAATRSAGTAPGKGGAATLEDFSALLSGAASPSPDASGNAAAMSQAFIASLGDLPSLQGEGMVNQIHVLRTSGAASQVSHLEAVTIDIVAMLFDFIFNDKDIPNGVKALVGRLQIPVLKVAMVDQSFFANRTHPARRFLDEISKISLRWGGSIDQQDPFFITLESLIERIQNEFQSDIGVFGRALDELHTFVDENESAEDSAIKAIADAAARQEREIAALGQAENAVRRVVTSAMPEVMADFFRTQWTQVLQNIAVAEGEDSPAWKDALQLIPDLAESIVPKKKPEERMALISALPSLLSRLNRGLDLAGTDKTARRPFFDALVTLHTAALKGERVAATPSKTAAAPAPEKTAAPAPNEGDLVITRSMTNGVEVEEVTLVGAQTAWRADDRDIARQVAELKRGDWVEFRQEEGSTSRERLTWMSPQRHLLVFSNHRAAKAISIAPEALMKMIRQGRASIVRDTPVFERAMSGVLESLNAS